MMSILDKLNERQKKAVCQTEGYVRVIAGAGSGKTRALSHRFAYLVNELGILPENILCITFTNKSANEMRQRIHQLTGDNDTGYISTFHGFCNTVLLEESHVISFPKNFIVLDNADIDEILKMIYEERNLTLRHMTFSAARDMIEIMKLNKKPDYYLSLISLSLEELKEVYEKARSVEDIIFLGYLYHQKKCFGLDYNDLIVLTLYIFSIDEEVKNKWQERLEYIMVDEFQDIDDLQYRLMEVLAQYHKNLFIVGDPDQTIYTWRGANIRYLLDFDQHFYPTKTIIMNQNYRSTQSILDVCNSLIDKNKNRIKKDLVSMTAKGNKPVVYFGKTQQDEADYIAKTIKELIKKGYERKDITILYRAHYMSRSIEDAFLKEEIPYMIYSGVQFFMRKEIKDALSYLRMIVYEDDLSFLRIVNTPKRNIGQQRIRFLQNQAAAHQTSLYEELKNQQDDPLFKNTKAKEFIALIEYFKEWHVSKSVMECLSAVLDKSGYEIMLRTEGAQDRLDNLAELKQSIHEYEISCGEETDLASYLQHVALYSNSDMEMKQDKVKMMTIHTAKGLEFPVVILAGLSEGMFPAKKVKSLHAMEEERRLAFVAMSRAKEKLYLSQGQGRNFDGSSRYPSRFILDIDKNLMDFTGYKDDKIMSQALEYIQIHQTSLEDSTREPDLKEGDLIEHPAFGFGHILSVDTAQKVYLVHFDKLKTERKISMRVKMKKVQDSSVEKVLN